MGETVSNAARTQASDVAIQSLMALVTQKGRPGVFFESAADHTPSQLVVEMVRQMYVSRCPHSRHRAISHLKCQRIKELDDIVHIMAFTRARQQATDGRRARSNDPSIICDAIPAAKAGRERLASMEAKEVELKNKLHDMERADHAPDQVEHIRHLLRASDMAEEACDAYREELVQLEAQWELDQETFQHGRVVRDTVFRTRMNAMLLDVREHQHRRKDIHFELQELERLLLAFDDKSEKEGTDAHDMSLVVAFKEQIELSEALAQALVRSKEQSRTADDSKAAEEVERMKRVLELQNTKLQLLDEIDLIERRINAMKFKKNS